MSALLRLRSSRAVFVAALRCFSGPSAQFAFIIASRFAQNREIRGFSLPPRIDKVKSL
jgi:hypothetical protein